MDIFQILNHWFEKRSNYWTSKGFIIKKHQPSEDRHKNTITIEIDKDRILSTITVWETGECDFLQVDENNSKQNKYFKNVILTDEKQTTWELDNYLYNFDSLKGSSVDPYHNLDYE